MDRLDIVKMYKKGCSLDYIIDEFYRQQRQQNKYIKTHSRKIIIINCPVKKQDIRSKVYKVIYEEKMKKDRPI